MNFIELENISYQYEGKFLLKNFFLSVQQGESVVIIGPSGCGKTTLFNLMTAADTHYTGSVLLNGQKPEYYNEAIAYLNQASLLFPFLTVQENIFLPIKYNTQTQNVAFQLEDIIDIFQLQDILEYYPYQLSGGMKQKVALARHLMIDSQLYLFDEAFSAIDYLTRILLQDSVIRFLKTKNKTSLFITHDIQEAILLSDKIIVLGESYPTNIIKEIQIQQNWEERRLDFLKSSRFNTYKTQILSLFF